MSTTTKTYTTVQEFLDDFQRAFDAATTSDQKDRLALARAVAIVDKDIKSVEKVLKTPNNVEVEVRNWLNKFDADYFDLGTEKTVSKTSSIINKTGFVSRDFADLLTKCVAGDGLAARECKNMLNGINYDYNSTITIPIKVGVGLLKTLGFKAGYGKYWRTSKEQNHFESVDEWVQRNKDTIDLTHSDYDNLRYILNIYVRIVNNHPDKWESDYVASDQTADPVSPKHAIRKLEGVVQPVVLERLAASVDEKTNWLAYLLPVLYSRASFEMTGGGYASDDQYNSHIDATTSVFRTGEVLKKHLLQLLSLVKAKGASIDQSEETALVNLADDLIKREKSLIQIVSLLEKSLALAEFYGKGADVRSANSLLDLDNVVASNRKLFEKVSNGRRRMIGALRVLVKYA